MENFSKFVSSQLWRIFGRLGALSLTQGLFNQTNQVFNQTNQFIVRHSAKKLKVVALAHFVSSKKVFGQNGKTMPTKQGQKLPAEQSNSNRLTHTGRI